MPIARSIYHGVWAHGVELQLNVEVFLYGANPKWSTGKAIEAAALVIFFISPNSFDKYGELKYELRFAFSLAQDKPLLVVVSEGSPVPSQLEQFFCIKGSDAESYAQLANEILRLKRSVRLDLAAGASEGRRVLRLFISYSHRDEQYRDELVKHLSSLLREGVIEISHDRRINPGEIIDTEIEQQMDDADVVLILVSPDFIASEYCYGIEMRRAMERYSRDAQNRWQRVGFSFLVVPVIIWPTDWRHTPFGKLLAMPKDGKPVTTWERADDAFVDIVAGVRRLIESTRHIAGHDGETYTPPAQYPLK
jgi:hypothetical protein